MVDSAHSRAMHCVVVDDVVAGEAVLVVDAGNDVDIVVVHVHRTTDLCGHW